MKVISGRVTRHGYKAEAGFAFGFMKPLFRAWKPALGIAQIISETIQKRVLNSSKKKTTWSFF